MIVQQYSYALKICFIKPIFWSKFDKSLAFTETLLSYIFEIIRITQIYAS